MSQATYKDLQKYIYMKCSRSGAKCIGSQCPLHDVFDSCDKKYSRGEYDNEREKR